MGNFKSTVTAMEVLQSATLVPHAHFNQDGTLALFDITTQRDDLLCPAQGRYVRDAVNKFHNLLVNEIGQVVLPFGIDKEFGITITMNVEEVHQRQLEFYLKNVVNTTLTELFQEKLIEMRAFFGPLFQDNLDRIYE